MRRAHREASVKREVVEGGTKVERQIRSFVLKRVLPPGRRVLY